MSNAATKSKKKYVWLWLKYAPDYRMTKDGTAKHKNDYYNEASHKNAIHRFMNMFYGRMEKLWQARMYDDDGNEIFKWKSPNMTENYEENQATSK